MIARAIIFCGYEAILACDAKCEKAWGCSSRPTKQLSDDIDDWESIPDDELGVAPDNPGTYEGECAKPRDKLQRLNKWCARECERSVIVRYNEEFELPDYVRRWTNIKNRSTARTCLDE